MLLDRINQLEDELLLPMSAAEFDSKLREWRNLNIRIETEGKAHRGEKISFIYIK